MFDTPGYLISLANSKAETIYTYASTTTYAINILVSVWYALNGGTAITVPVTITKVA